MRWRRGTSTPDVIDARGRTGGRGGALPRAGGGLGLVGVVVFLLFQVLGGGGGGGFAVEDPFGESLQAPGSGQARGIPASQDPERDLRDFTAYVFTQAQATWQGTFDRAGQPYERAKLVLYRGSVPTGCGQGQAATGPFYCPADRRVYMDLSFFGEMERRLGAPGDFAWAYVIAHEVGHHVQQQLGTNDRVARLERDDPGSRNELSVRVELQADCYAGVWAQTAFEAGELEPGDVEEALGAASAVGDDRLQEAAGRRADPESFTHGSAAQRRRWFDAGRNGGRPADCDTFAGDL